MKSFFALFAIVNPIGNLPIVVELGQNYDACTRRKMHDLAAGAGFLALLALTVFGQWIMESVFHITLAEFKIAGGILLTAIAVRNIILHGSISQHMSGKDIMELSIVPLAIPLLVGPGAVVTGILILNRDGLVVVVTCIAVVFATTWVILRMSSQLARLLGRYGTAALSRILQIFIAAIGVHFLTSGIKELFVIGQ
ncbi:MAG: MarC family protein [Vicinamibacteria bacterium]|nr:MarC family protein [Vicinamibacteria bacterium]